MDVLESQFAADLDFGGIQTAQVGVRWGGPCAGCRAVQQQAAGALPAAGCTCRAPFESGFTWCILAATGRLSLFVCIARQHTNLSGAPPACLAALPPAALPAAGRPGAGSSLEGRLAQRRWAAGGHPLLVCNSLNVATCSCAGWLSLRVVVLLTARHKRQAAAAAAAYPLKSVPWNPPCCTSQAVASLLLGAAKLQRAIKVAAREAESTGYQGLAPVTSAFKVGVCVATCIRCLGGGTRGRGNGVSGSGAYHYCLQGMRVFCTGEHCHSTFQHPHHRRTLPRCPSWQAPLARPSKRAGLCERARAKKCAGRGDAYARLRGGCAAF